MFLKIKSEEFRVQNMLRTICVYLILHSSLFILHFSLFIFYNALKFSKSSAFIALI